MSGFLQDAEAWIQGELDRVRASHALQLSSIEAAMLLYRK